MCAAEITACRSDAAPALEISVIQASSPLISPPPSLINSLFSWSTWVCSDTGDHSSCIVVKRDCFGIITSETAADCVFIFGVCCCYTKTDVHRSV